MDIQMPEMNGHTATEIIRNRLPEPIRSIPVMAMTAHATRDEREKCQACGMNGYITKPFEAEELRNMIFRLTKKEEAAYNTIPGFDGDSNIMRLNVNHSSNSQVRKNGTSGKIQESDPKEIFPHKINLTYLKQISDGNDAFIIEMIEMFLNKTPKALEEMNEHFKRQNWEELRQIAHRIKPSFTYIGLPDIQKALAEIERLTADSSKEPATVSQLLGRVDTASRSVFQQLQQELATLR
ncbi:MAG: response regulator, partial [Bacteroidota bacterium]